MESKISLQYAMVRREAVVRLKKERAVELAKIPIEPLQNKVAKINESRQADLKDGRFQYAHCHVLGLHDYCDTNGTYPVFVCELDDGSVIDVMTSLVRFIDTIKGGFLAW